jgi:hypothetical protein
MNQARERAPSRVAARHDESEDELGYEPEEIQHQRDPDYRFRVDKELQQRRLQLTFEDIIQKYSRDFSDIGDEVDLLTGKIVVDRGHLRSMRNEKDMDGGSRQAHDDAADSDPKALLARHSGALQPRHAYASWSAAPPLNFDPLQPWGADVVANPLWRAPELPIPRFTIKSSFAADLFADKYSIPVRDHTNSIWGPNGDQDDDRDDAASMANPQPRRPLLTLRRPKPTTMTKVIKARPVDGSDDEDSVLLGPGMLPPLPPSSKPPAGTIARQSSGTVEGFRHDNSGPSERRVLKRKGRDKKSIGHLPSPQSSVCEPATHDLVSTAAKPERNQAEMRRPSQTLFVELCSGKANDSSYIRYDDDRQFPTPPPSDCGVTSPPAEKPSTSEHTLTISDDHETVQDDLLSSGYICAAKASASPTQSTQPPEPSHTQIPQQAETCPATRNKQPETAAVPDLSLVDMSYDFSDEERGYTKKRKRSLPGLTTPSQPSTKPACRGRPKKQGRRSAQLHTSPTVAQTTDDHVGNGDMECPTSGSVAKHLGNQQDGVEGSRPPSTTKPARKQSVSKPSPTTPSRSRASPSTPKSTRSLLSLTSEDELVGSPCRPKIKRRRTAVKPDFFTRVAAEKTTTPTNQGPTPPAAGHTGSAVKRKGPVTPVKLNNKKDLFYSPGGTLRECGENGVKCGGDFCMTCFGESD